MSQPQEYFATRLKTAGQSLTAARQTVFTVLLGQEPMTMAALVSRCTGVDRASVYRTVGLYEELGILQRLQQGWKYTLELTDAFHDHHHHATCTSCGRLIALPENKSFELQLKTLADGIGFTLQQHQLELQGICSSCQQQDLVA